MDFAPYLSASDIVDFHHPLIQNLVASLYKEGESDAVYAKRCFEWVRDTIHHTGDFKDTVSTWKASDVLAQKTGWCYAKSHLLAALLRAKGIPTAFCYQRLSCGEYKQGVYCLHGLNAIYLKAYGWYRVDARGNKEGVNAQFTPPIEQLAFEVGDDEVDSKTLYSEPLPIIIETLKRYEGYDAMVHHFPDNEL